MDIDASNLGSNSTTENDRQTEQMSQYPSDSVAIIGMTCRFPGANNADQFWNNLINGTSSVTEIPPERWDANKYYSTSRQEENKTVSKWGGFIADADKFDAAFFHISRPEAELMDPQQRIILELAWHCFEDAGYAPEHFSGSATGVFVGAMNFDYREQVARSGSAIEAHMSTGLHTTLIPNRISHFFNLTGPSVPIDTACSSSLVALHEAVHALQRGECKYALAGGISILCSPTHFISFSKTGMLSPNGKCRTFDERADGYVRSEGAGLVLLKPLAEAIKDNDRIYGVIRGTAMNHGGHARTLTHPNPAAQSEVIMAAHRRANISPDTVSYIEAHGTGTPKGDPIEIDGLKRAFSGLSERYGVSLTSNACGIGSIKTNIGHLESAAGIAGLIKVLLCIKNSALPKIAHFEKLNHRISLENTPFYIVDKNVEWRRLQDDQGQNLPRRAGVSSFGFGGVNAHVVVEEYIGHVPAALPPANSPVLIVLSAKDAAQLRKQVEQLRDAIQSNTYAEAALASIAYTLQVGRAAMETRLAILTTSLEELRTKLNSYLVGEQNIAGIFYGDTRSADRQMLDMFDEESDLQAAAAKWIQRHSYSKILSLWVQGLSFDWKQLYQGHTPARISLPFYPFAKERYWAAEPGITMTSGPHAVPSLQYLHPLLHINTSDLKGPRFTSHFTGEEFFFSEHSVTGASILPGVAYLEMAYAASSRASGQEVSDAFAFKIKNVVWTRSMPVYGEKTAAHLLLQPKSASEIDYEIRSESSSADFGSVVHSQGRVVIETQIAPTSIDIEARKAQCQGDRYLSSTEFYASLNKLGLTYGPTFSLVEDVYLGAKSAFAKLRLPALDKSTHAQFSLHPGVMDSAVQVALTFFTTLLGKNSLSLPFSLQELEIRRLGAAIMWVVARPSDSVRPEEKSLAIDIDLCDEKGSVCIRFKSLSFRELSQVKDPESPGNINSLLLRRDWEERSDTKQSPVPAYARWIVFGCNVAVDPDQITPELHGMQWVNLNSHGGAAENAFEQYAYSLFKELQNILRSKPTDEVLVQVVVSTSGVNRILASLCAMLKTAHLENPKLIGQLIQLDSNEDPHKLVTRLKEVANQPADQVVRYEGSKQLVERWKELTSTKKEMPWKAHGVYLITGGTGGLGHIFAKEIARQTVEPTLVLTGRSPLDANKRAQIAELEGLRARVEYLQFDVARDGDTEKLIQQILGQHGGLNGILHAAGLIQDNFLLKKTSAEVEAVLAPKVRGLVNLDKASSDIPLDCFICFSSIAGARGSVGQSDYATANAFMDSYAQYRNSLVSQGKRYGRTLSVNWPLWRDGGMRVDEITERLFEQSIGMVAMRTETGVQALYHAFGSGHDQVIVLEGVTDRMRKIWLDNHPSTNMDLNSPKMAQLPSLVPRTVIWDKAVHYFQKVFSSILSIPIDHIELDAQFEKYGVDSIIVTEVTVALEKTFGSLSKTLLFEYQTLRALVEYFFEHYQADLTSLLNIERSGTAAGGSTEAIKSVESQRTLNTLGETTRAHSPYLSIPRTTAAQLPDVQDDIAIVGMSGRYPGADNLETFWEILKEGKDCITEVPEDRWDHKRFFDSDQTKPGKTYSKWGGFIDGVDKFDPQFFNISPREAELMDPQERLFLECAYASLEDAGYTRHTIEPKGNVGVYVGVMWEEYQLYAAQETVQGRVASVWGLSSSIANRVSHFFDFHGPSIALNTMCSSSLTSLHMACESIRRGECEVAISGGVNLTLHPNKYLFLAQGKFISSTGHCRSFGRGGDGYVPSEGVGAIVLKPKLKAIADGDHIYGIIKGSAVNHGGRVNGYTVPNPNAQADVVLRAIKQSKIDARAISYLEAHGTGTSLGDPIEVTGLSKAFKAYTDEKQFCAIGSAKSNIGHCESAAGIAGVTKVLLQLKHKTLAPSLHSRELNPNIDFPATPFKVQQLAATWQRPVLTVDNEPREYPRIAGISSFGAGGTNAHVIIEEHVETDFSLSTSRIGHSSVCVVLSARNEDRLFAKASQLLAAIQSNAYSNDELPSIAYTLQVGREPMEERLAFIVGSIDELQNKLSEFLAKKNDISGFYRGQSKRNKALLSVFASDEELEEAIQKWAQREKYGKLLSLWVMGLAFDWNKIYNGNHPKRISLPTYPFKGERYWVPQMTSAMPSAPADGIPNGAVLHPLLHRNTSDFSEQRFSSLFTGREFFLSDHLVEGARVLPGVAYLEMARIAALRATGRHEKGVSTALLKNIVWIQPIVVREEAVETHIRLSPKSDDIRFEIYTNHEGEPVIHGCGVFVQESEPSSIRMDLAAIRKECNRSEITPESLYEFFQKNGLQYGPSHQAITEVYFGEKQAVARLSLKPSIQRTGDQYYLHPGIMDGALQAAAVFMNFGTEETRRIALPFALDALEVIAPCNADMWAIVRHCAPETARDLYKFDIDLCNDHGQVHVRLLGLSMRVPRTNPTKAESRESVGTLELALHWEKRDIEAAGSPPEYAHQVVLLCDQPEIDATDVEREINGSRCLSTERQTNCATDFHNASLILFKSIQMLLKSKLAGPALLQVVVPMSGSSKVLVGLSSILKTAQLENPKLLGQIIEVEAGESTISLITKLKANSKAPGDTRIRYDDGERHVANWKELIPFAGDATAQWKDGGVFLITGGAGGLGLLFAEEISKRAKAPKLILTGRSQLSDKQMDRIRTLETFGAIVEYVQMDVTDKKSVTQVIAGIQDKYGDLNTVIHGAGLLRDSLIVNKSIEHFEEVLAPKVAGTVNLDECTKQLRLDYFICFSSVAGALGNPGQVDYAAANGFMDAYAEYRETLVALGQRHGRAISINWPLWKHGGMHVSEATEQIMEQTTGMVPMRTATGMAAFYRALASGECQVLIMEGLLSRMKSRLLPTKSTRKPPVNISPAVAPDSLSTHLKRVLAGHVASLLKVRPEDIDEDAELNEYGFDSITLTQFSSRLNSDYQLELAPSLFFDHSTLNRLADYLIKEHSSAFTKKSEQQSDEKIVRVEALHDTVKSKLTDMLTKLLKVRPEDIDGDGELNEYGVDSITLTEFSATLNREYQLEVSPSLFFEQSTLNRLTDYFVKEHGQAFAPRNGKTDTALHGLKHQKAATSSMQNRTMLASATGPSDWRAFDTVRNPESIQVGLKRIVVGGSEEIPVALYYATSSQATKKSMGAYSPTLAQNGKLPESITGLILVSHCSGGNDLVHYNLASCLAKLGYLVAAPEHPGDNWHDTSLSSTMSYIPRRTRQLSQVLDAILKDDAWKDKIPSSRIGVIGHSAGAASALALIGGIADPLRLATEYGLSTANPLLGGTRGDPAPPTVQSLRPLFDKINFDAYDPRIKAAVLMAPLGILFEPKSLSKISVPVKIYTAEKDAVLAGYNNDREYIKTKIPHAEYEEVEGAGHFVFMAPSEQMTNASGSDDMVNASGLGRDAFHARLEQEICNFFERNLQ